MIERAAIKAADARIHAFVDWEEELVGPPVPAIGPLSGLTVGVKANIAVAGLPWTGGMGLYRNRIAAEDADVVARLRKAGATILGTLNMHEAALGATTDNPFYGRTHNPHRIGFTPGGSSGGSAAAVAAGLCDIALGSDTLGSIRIPAAYCGVYGLKPSHGAVSPKGLMALEPTLDVIGPLAASLPMLASAWQSLRDEDAVIASRSFKRLILLSGIGRHLTDGPVNIAYQNSVQRTGLSIEHIALPHDLRLIREAGLAACIAALNHELGAAVSDAGVSPELRRLLGLTDRLVPRPDVLADTAQRLIEAVGSDGVLLLPTAPQTAFAHGQHAPSDQADFTSLASVAGLPALSLPAGVSDDGLPVAIQLVGPAGSEESLIALAARFDDQIATRSPGRQPGRET